MMIIITIVPAGMAPATAMAATLVTDTAIQPMVMAAYPAYGYGGYPGYGVGYPYGGYPAYSGYPSYGYGGYPGYGGW
jgi:hypothetical protein